MGVGIFVVLDLCLSKGLLILERGAKIPEEKKTEQVMIYVIKNILYRVVT